MKVLICLSLFFGVAFCEQEFGAYKYTEQISKPQLPNEQYPIIYVRHVPSPVTKLPVVPIIHVMPPMRILQQQIQQVVANNIPSHAGSARSLWQDVQQQQQVPEYVYNQIHQEQEPVPPQTVPQSRKVVIVNNIPAHAQLGSARSLWQDIQPLEEQQQVQEYVYNQIQQEQEPVPPQTVTQYIQDQPHQGITAQDVQLVNGFTVEVAKATQEHLSHVAAARASIQAAKE